MRWGITNTHTDHQDEDIAHFSRADITTKIIHPVCNGMHLPSDVYVTPSIWEDSEIRPWIDSHVRSHGGKEVAWHILQHPTSDIPLLQTRQSAVAHVMNHLRQRAVYDMLTEFRAVEPDIQWLSTRPSISDCTSLQLLYPSFFALRFINQIPILLAALHIYKGYVAPFTNIMTPLSTVFGPYMYLRRMMGPSFTLSSYLKLFMGLMSKLTKPNGNFRTDATKFGTLGIYIGMFAMGIFQSIELAASVRRVQRLVIQKTKIIREFVATSFPLIQQIPETVWKSFGVQGDEQEFSVLQELPKGASFLYKYLNNVQLQHGFHALLRRLYLLDAMEPLQHLLHSKEACIVSFHDGHVATKLFHMGHIHLPSKQVRNPCSLEKSLIITGPNAGGKTTYVKSICSNYILAQTFGIAIAQQAQIAPQQALGSFMRIQDHVGNKSLFEAEVTRCAEIVAHAKQISDAGKTATYFLDEPMHSTPPAEGASASIATVHYLGKLPGIRVIVTTHFFELTQLADHTPHLFQNVSMEAIPTSGDNKQFVFPYRIRKGPSFQCIALELLEKNSIPSELVECAIKWKNKICPMHVK